MFETHIVWFLIQERQDHPDLTALQVISLVERELAYMRRLEESNPEKKQKSSVQS